jgi:solute carrier family 66, member 2
VFPHLFSGVLSLGIEAMLGVPQLLRNRRTRSTAGLNAILIGSWFVGDGFKTVYFVMNGAPIQFIGCGAFQLTMDTLILWQMLAYRGKSVLK